MSRAPGSGAEYRTTSRTAVPTTAPKESAANGASCRGNGVTVFQFFGTAGLHWRLSAIGGKAAAPILTWYPFTRLVHHACLEHCRSTGPTEVHPGPNIRFGHACAATDTRRIRSRSCCALGYTRCAISADQRFEKCTRNTATFDKCSHAISKAEGISAKNQR